MKNKHKIHFIHANGFPPGAYQSLFNNLKSETIIQNFLLRPLDPSLKNTTNEINDWIPFHHDFIKSLDNKEQIIGLGHSIGGNIILRAGISHPDLFKKIILLDPTLFIPRIIFIWKFITKLNLQNRFHPWVNATLNRKMKYKNYNEIFKSYRNKKVFSKIDDTNLKFYIESITKNINNNLHVNYSKEWEHRIYKTGLIKDNFIWKNIQDFKIPTLILKAEHSNAFINSTANRINKINSNNIKIITIKGTSHLFPMEVPDKVSDLILDFIL